jgi:hypothetical protein
MGQGAGSKEQGTRICMGQGAKGWSNRKGESRPENGKGIMYANTVNEI